MRNIDHNINNVRQTIGSTNANKDCQIYQNNSELQDGGIQKQNFNGNSEPVNPFLFSGNVNNGDNKNSDQSIENVKQMGSVTNINPVKDVCFINIIGEIEGHTSLPPQSKTTKYEHIIPMIIGAEMDPQIKGVLMLINTMGGDVEAGLAISELVASITKPTVSLVLGGGHSIGTALAVSTNYSFIAPTGTMTIHPIRTNGLVIGVPQTFRYFQKMQERITSFIVSNSRVNKEQFLKYMYDTDEIANDVGTVVNSDEAVQIGLIDEIGGFSSAMLELRKLIDKMEDKNPENENPVPINEYR